MLVRCVFNPKTVMGISQYRGVDQRNLMHVGKEYTLCRVITIQIAMSAVKDVSWEGSSVGPVSVFGGK